jgi:thioredoxin-related protein
VKVRGAWLYLWIAVAAAGSQALAQPPVGEKIPQAVDLRADGERAANMGVPILLAVTQEGCSYCDLLKRSVLRPMILSGEYSERVIIRELSTDPVVPVTVFDGRERASDALAREYSATVVPTVLLLDPRGKPLHKPITGINTVELYGYYLDRAIEEATLAMAASLHDAEVGGEN